MTTAVSIAFSIASAIGKIKEGQAQEAMYKGVAQGYEVQAQYTRFNAKQESLKHKKQAADVLEATLMRMASINAAAGAGHMDPFSGNPFGLRIRALNVGGTNYAMSGLNETLTRLTGEQQAKIQEYHASRLRLDGKQAASKGMMGAMMTLAGGAFKAFQTSIPTSTVPTTGPGAFGGAGGVAQPGGSMLAPVSGAGGMPPSMMPNYYGTNLGGGYWGT